MGDRLRFAPSPTGSLHVGNARTALINWLVARHDGGALVLRIEDTDAERSDVANEETILQDLAWLGLDFDEGPGLGGDRGPYRQSERAESYKGAVAQLLASGAVYPSFETADEMAAMRKDAAGRGESLCFRGEHRDATPAQVLELMQRGGAALRFKVPPAEVGFVDDLRGATGLAADEISDFVVARADGTSTYNLAVVVDDHDMGIDRVIRGEDHLTNTSRQILLYEALGWPVPRFAHLPLVLGSDRSRLSKRHGATSVAQMRERGILPAALCNFLALLGWSPPEEQEVLPMDQLLAAFEITDMAAANSIFDETKLDWLNGQHMALLSPAELSSHAVPFLVADGIEPPADEAARGWFDAALALVGIGRRRLTELGAPYSEAFYPADSVLVEAAAEVREDEQATAVVAAFAAAGDAGRLADESGYLEVVNEIKEATGARGRGLFHPLRLAVCGQDSGPELKVLIPLIEQGAKLSLQQPVASVAERCAVALQGSDG